MTSDEYRAVVKGLGLLPIKKCYDGGTLHKTREGDFTIVIDPEPLSASERKDVLKLLKARLGIIAN